MVSHEGPGSEGDEDDLDVESPGTPQPRQPLGFSEGPAGMFRDPKTDAAFRMAMLVKSGRQDSADAIYREITGREPPPSRQQDNV